MNFLSYNRIAESNLVRILVWALAVFTAAILWFLISNSAQAANFSISPSSGTYTVGSTFEVSVVTDTKGQTINAVQLNLSFPVDKLQLVSPSAGNSIISIYTTPPKYDNSTGKIEIIGGIPNGINTSNGLITKLTFRVKGVGNASLRFTGDLQILLNDGRGTNVLENTFGATYKLELPPQQGPIVISDTHPDQEIWYKNSNVNLIWDVGLPAATNYSYTISDNPTDVPDDTPETQDTKASYNKVPDGINYFHIKAYRDGHWGGVSHYGLKIDNLAPAEFKITISPSSRTFVKNPFAQFTSSDSLSGLDRFELKVLPLKIEGKPKAIIDDQLFVDAQSPYQIPELLNGSYSVIVRAYDKAGNFREISQKLEITDSWFWFLSQDGIVLPFGRQVSWGLILPIFLILLFLLLVAAYIVRRWYKLAHGRIIDNHLPGTIQTQLSELEQYRSKYGKMMSGFLLMVIIGASVMFAGSSLFADFPIARAQEIPPPVIASYSANIKDDELFYVSGRTTEPLADVVVHLQSLVDGGSFDFTTTSDKRGDWTYRHSSFLEGGKYIIWAHTKMGAQLSSPSPQVELDVKPIAINWGNSRITYQSLYIGLILGLFVMLVALIAYIIVHAILVRRRRKVFAANLRQTEDSIKRGFISLRRDIEAELVLMRQANLSQELSGEQKVREQQLKEDLKNIEELVGKEVWQIETFEQLPTRSS